MLSEIIRERETSTVWSPSYAESEHKPKYIETDQVCGRQRQRAAEGKQKAGASRDGPPGEAPRGRVQPGGRCSRRRPALHRRAVKRVCPWSSYHKEKIFSFSSFFLSFPLIVSIFCKSFPEDSYSQVTLFFPHAEAPDMKICLKEMWLLCHRLPLTESRLPQAIFRGVLVPLRKKI